jgi:tetratricopeptide (TPR) repeat protein
LRIEAEREAVEQLADFAASKVTPRRIIESIRLDNTAPRFEEVYALIRDDRFAEARQIWTNELKKNPRSAALRLDLGAVCEALGDNAAARHLYEAAIAVDPMNDRYGKAIEELDHRALDAAMLQLRPTALR